MLVTKSLLHWWEKDWEMQEWSNVIWGTKFRVHSELKHRVKLYITTNMIFLFLAQFIYFFRWYRLSLFPLRLVENSEIDSKRRTALIVLRKKGTTFSVEFGERVTFRYSVLPNCRAKWNRFRGKNSFSVRRCMEKQSYNNCILICTNNIWCSSIVENSRRTDISE